MVVCLERGADLHMHIWCHCHSLSLPPVKSRLVLPFWYRLTWVVRDKGPLNGCVCVSCYLLMNKTYLRITKSLHNEKSKKVKVAHTQLPSVGFWSWSRFLAVSLQVTWVINPAVGCHYFPSGPQLPSQPLRGLLPVSLLGEQRHNGCEQFAQDCYPTASWLRFQTRPFCVESSMLTTRLPSHPVVGNSKEKSNYPTRDNSGIHLPWYHISDSCKSQSSVLQTITCRLNTVKHSKFFSKQLQ